MIIINTNIGYDNNDDDDFVDDAAADFDDDDDLCLIICIFIVRLSLKQCSCDFFMQTRESKFLKN